MTVFEPSKTLLVKLGSIAVHVDELLSPQSSHFDATTVVALLDDPEVKDWLKEMDELALLPKKR